MTDNGDAMAGAIATAGGATGLTIQLFTSFANLTVTLLNILLALGGLYLLFLKIRQAHRNNR
jgi:hypothetical protein